MFETIAGHDERLLPPLDDEEDAREDDDDGDEETAPCDRCGRPWPWCRCDDAADA